MRFLQDCVDLLLLLVVLFGEGRYRVRTQALSDSSSDILKCYRIRMYFFFIWIAADKFFDCFFWLWLFALFLLFFPLINYTFIRSLYKHMLIGCFFDN